MTTLAEDIAFEKKAEKMLASHREVPNGRNFLAWVMRYQDNDSYRSKFDQTFPESPSSKTDLDSKYCQKCDKLKSWCEC